MPIFVSNTVNNAGLPASLVFAIFMLNSAGGIGGYFLAGSRSTRSAGGTGLGKIVMSRSLLAFLLIAGLELPSHSVILATTILVLLGFASAMFVVHTLSLSMELIPAGKAGMYNALIGVGGAFGSFIGPFIAQTFSFLYVFIVAGVIFFLAYVAFRFFA
jgi:MFS family permease